MKEMFKRMFSAKKPESITKSHRYPKPMWSAIEQLAEKAGETPNSFVVLVLDQYLQVQLENGNLDWSRIKPSLKDTEKTA